MTADLYSCLYPTTSQRAEITGRPAPIDCQSGEASPAARIGEDGRVMSRDESHDRPSVIPYHHQRDSGGGGGTELGCQRMGAQRAWNITYMARAGHI